MDNEQSEDADNNNTNNIRLKSRTNSKQPFSRYNSAKSKNANGEETYPKKFSKFNENHYNLIMNGGKPHNFSSNELTDNKLNKNLSKNKKNKSIEIQSRNVLPEKANNDSNYNKEKRVVNLNVNRDTQQRQEPKKKKSFNCNCLLF